MKVSVITVCFNSEKTIKDTIESVLEQDYPNIEYIVIDGNSTDATVGIIEQHKEHINTVVSEPDKGLYDAMNKGIGLASGDVIGILNSDDFYASANVISQVVDKFKSNPQQNMVFGDVVFVDSVHTSKIIRYYNSHYFQAWKLRFGWMPPHTGCFIKRSVYEQIGKYSLDYKISADYEFFIRALMINKMTFSRVNTVLVKMRAGGISTSGIKNRLLLNKEIVKACKNNGIYTNLFLVLLKIPFKLTELFKKPLDTA